ncbi:hypothetical protein EYS14_03570 [Alteromonadaceae bacterium M269]|nr:hypothetical protein EYS14_03570 [Alteromonadaceae bacterium M269]
MAEKKLFRFVDTSDAEGIRINCTEFFVVRETKCFYFVVSSWEYNMMKMNTGWQPSRIRKVGKNSIRAHCYLDKKKALNSYLAMKKKQAFYSEFNLSVANQVLEHFKNESDEVAQTKLETESKMNVPIYCGKPEFFENIGWYE